MVHDQRLLEVLDSFTREEFSGEVYRATRLGLDPLAPSSARGRWSHRDATTPILYTSLERDGAIAEMAFHLGQLDPLPKKPIGISRLSVSTNSTLRLLHADHQRMGVDADGYQETHYKRTKEIGAAVAFLECDGLIAPSARWDTDNLMLFIVNQHHQNTLELIETSEVDWIRWADENRK